MASIFDGLAGILNGVFGAPVTWTSEIHGATVIQAVFRITPVRVPSEDGGETLVVTPTLEVQKPTADDIARGDEIAPDDGNTYLVVARQHGGSPAGDAFVLFELEKMT